MRRELTCVAPSAPPRLEVRTRAVPAPRAGEVLVRVVATSVNPIDAKRPAGYGRRLLGLKGAASFPLVLGNDVAGTVEALGSGVTGFRRGQSVFGLVATGRNGGAHASHVVVPRELLAIAEEDADTRALAVLPYTFTTMWLAVRSSGLTPSNAEGRRILVNGASGGLGRLSIQLLRRWGSRVTAICGQSNVPICLALGAENAFGRGPATIGSLPPDFDAVLNFGSWTDEYPLASRLAPKALGQATTVHPLLPNFDRLGWWGGALASRTAWKMGQAAVKRRSPGARYSWTVFRPERDALDALVAGLRDGTFSLPVGICAHFDEAAGAFAHVDLGSPGRAVLLPHASDMATNPSHLRTIANHWGRLDQVTTK